MHDFHAAFHDSFARLIPGFSTQNLHKFNLYWGMLHSWKFSNCSFSPHSRIYLLVIFNSSHSRNQKLIGQVQYFSTTLGFWTSPECLLVVSTRCNHSVLVQLTYCGQSGMPRTSVVLVLSQNWPTCTQFMQHYTIPLHDWYLGAQPKIHNFGQNSRIDLLVIFNSSYCRLVSQVLFPTTLDFWTSLECLLVGKDFNLSSCNIFKGATACWQDQHTVESFSSNSSGIVALLLAALESPAGTLLHTLQGSITPMRAFAHCGWQYQRAPPWRGEACLCKAT